MAGSGRKVNFSKRELHTIIDMVGQNKPVIFGKFTESLTRDTKAEKWQAITNAVNGVEGRQRSVADVKRKWTDFASRTKQKEAARRRQMGRTGGGSQPKDLNEEENMVLAIIGEVAVGGIPGGVDASASVSTAAPVESPAASTSCVPDSAPDSVNEDSVGSQSQQNETDASDASPGARRWVRRRRRVSDTDLYAVEKTRLSVERERLAIEKERLSCEKKRLELEEEKVTLLREYIAQRRTEDSAEDQRSPLLFLSD